MTFFTVNRFHSIIKMVSNFIMWQSIKLKNWFWYDFDRTHYNSEVLNIIITWKNLAKKFRESTLKCKLNILNEKYSRLTHIYIQRIGYFSIIS